MADEDDPREVQWHPRHARRVLGHDQPRERFGAALTSGKPHHAWLLHGPKGIGKATFAYALARQLLAETNPAQTEGWIAARAHPDLFVLQRSLSDTKPVRLRSEISVEDARGLAAFFARTSGSGGWRVAILDAVDDLNTESANALLKLVEEPPAKALLLLVCHVPGKALRTLRSRCLSLALSPLRPDQTLDILGALPLDPKPTPDALDDAVRLQPGSPGSALDLLNSAGAKAFQAFLQKPRLSDAERLAIANHFSSRQQAYADYMIFQGLLLDWLARQAAQKPRDKTALRLSEIHARLSAQQRVVEGYNLDRRQAVLEALGNVRDALKAA